MQRLIIGWLRTRGILCWRNNTTGIWDGDSFRSNNGFGARNGVPDILGMLRCGRFLAIEVKLPVGKVSQEQKEFIEDVNKNGGLAFVARSLSDLKEHIA